MLREKTLEDERIKLADIIKFFNNQKKILDELIQSLENLKNSANSFLDNYNPSFINNYNSYVSKITNDILVQKETLKKVESDLNNQKEVVKKAYVQVKILEKLKEKQKEKYDKEVLLEEIKFIDDIVTSRKRA